MTQQPEQMRSTISLRRILQMLIYVALMAATPLAAVRYQAAMRDPDIWWHLRVGESILKTHSFPHTAIFSRFAATNSWYAYSWFFEVTVARVYGWFSLAGLPLFLMLFQIAIAALLVWSAIEITKSEFLGCVLAGAALAASFHTMSLRPVLFTVLFFILEMAIIFRALREGRVERLYWLPLLFWVWCNCHIQFIYGLLVLGLLFGCEFMQPYISAKVADASPDLPWKKIALVLGGCVGATLLSPYSWRLYGVVWGLASHAEQWNEITELLAPDFRRPAHFVELLLAASAALALGMRRSRSLFRISLLIVASAVSFRAVRDAWMISIVAMFLVGEALASTVAELPAKRMRAIWVSVAAMVAFGVCLAAQSQIGFSTATLIPELDQRFPVRASSFLADSHPPGPLYNSMAWGGYLMYNLREYPVSVDGRTDAHAATFGDSIHVLKGLPGWKEDPTFASSNIVLIEKNLPLARLLARDRDFRLIYEDHLAMIFERVRR